MKEILMTLYKRKLTGKGNIHNNYKNN